MKIRTSVFIVAVAAVASWALPGTRQSTTQMAHEFLRNTTPSSTSPAAHVQPVQLAVLFQSVDR